MKTRMLMIMTSGRAPRSDWERLLREEEATGLEPGRPRGCEGCPLAPGGEWEDGCKSALADGLNPKSLLHFACHEHGKRCAGAARLSRAQP